jgi:hypothetical protein
MGCFFLFGEFVSMNVFVLSTGRCASTTFVEACKHITNYTAGHESRSCIIGYKHFSFPENHIEVDNRLSWFLGWIDEIYGDNAYYVHLIRKKEAVAESFNKRWDWDVSLIRAYGQHVLTKRHIKTEERLDICLDLWETINKNIDMFLKNKTKKMIFNLEDHKRNFCDFWGNIGAEGDLDGALLEWENKHNASIKEQQFKLYKWKKPLRILKKLPNFIKEA